PHRRHSHVRHFRSTWGNPWRYRRYAGNRTEHGGFHRASGWVRHLCSSDRYLFLHRKQGRQNLFRPPPRAASLSSMTEEGFLAAPLPPLTRPSFLGPSLSPAHGCLEARDPLCDSVLKISYPPEWLTHTSSSIPSNERPGNTSSRIPKWEVKMNRRNFLKTAAIATTASTIAAPAIAQPTPELHWRMALSWPKSLDTLFGACEQFAKRVAELTDNKFQIQLFAAGEIVPGLQVLDAVQNGTVEAGNTGGYLLLGQGSVVRLLDSRSVWPQHAPGRSLVQLAPGDIYPSLEKGTIDAAEWVGPYDDEKLGFVKVAKYYYSPGWWEGGANGVTLINLEKWQSLSKTYQAVVTSAAHEASLWLTSKYDYVNPPAIRRLVSAGDQIRVFSQEQLEAAYKAANETYAEISQTNPRFKKLLDSMMAFRNDSYQWWQVCELPYDTFQIRMRGKA